MVAEIGPLCRVAPGHLDWQIIRPVAGLTTSYTVIIGFHTSNHLRQWMGSQERRQLIDKVRPLPRVFWRSATRVLKVACDFPGAFGGGGRGEGGGR